MIKIPEQEECEFADERRDYGCMTVWTCSWTPPGTEEGPWRTMIEWCHDGPPPTDIMNKALKRQAYLRLCHMIWAHNRYEEQNA